LIDRLGLERDDDDYDLDLEEDSNFQTVVIETELIERDSTK